MDIEIVSHWDHYIELFPNHHSDIYFKEGYVNLHANDLDTPLCVVCKEDGFILLMPFLRREFRGYYDVETPYGYGGPIYNEDDPQKIDRAIVKIGSHFKESSYLAGFIRFHPLLHNSNACEKYMTVIADRKTVAIDTSISIEEIWKTESNTKNRNTIRKAQSSGLTFIVDYEFEYINSFIELYTATMQKLSADEFYYFNSNYFSQFISQFKGSSFIGLVKENENVIAAALFMYTPPYGHYHLSGSDVNYLHLNPNNFLLFEAAKELKKHDVTLFHLGGGNDSSEHNSLWEFKKKFSRNYYQFSIGKWIFNQENYNRICDKWMLENPDKAEKYKHHLLKYRY